MALSDEYAVQSAAWTDAPPEGPPVALKPTAGHVSKKRVVGIDAARGVALLGMVAVHALYESNAQGNPTVSFTIAAGRSAALFAVLAGVGISLSTGRQKATMGREGCAAAASLVARALALAVIGLALGQFDSTFGTVILVYYGALFLLAIPLLFLPTRAVVVTGVVIAFVVPVLSQLVRGGLPASLGDHPTAAYLLASPVRVLADVFVTGEYPALPWLAYVCAGLAIGRLQLSSLQVARRLFGAGVTMAVLAKLVAWVALGPLGGSDRIFA
ncbi:MAG TPA: heparan-alpha-glucosaminide N-acetyltransferase domain-containing protein, partial [Dermatophilaceae bacterium]